MLIDHKATHVYFVSDYQFMPGVNSVSKEEWEKIKAHPHVQHLIEDDKMKVLSEKDSSKEGEHTLAEFDVKKATKVIEQTFDLELLSTWDSDEKRKPLRLAITNQMKKIMGKAYSKREESGENEASDIKVSKN